MVKNSFGRPTWRTRSTKALWTSRQYSSKGRPKIEIKHELDELERHLARKERFTLVRRSFSAAAASASSSSCRSSSASSTLSSSAGPARATPSTGRQSARRAARRPSDHCSNVSVMAVDQYRRGQTAHSRQLHARSGRGAFFGVLCRRCHSCPESRRADRESVCSWTPRCL